MTIMKVLYTARLSRKIHIGDGDQARGAQTGLESQDAEYVGWAEREGHTLVHVAADFKSGVVAPWNRPNLRPWVTEPGKLAQYDAVVAYRFDRLSRGDDRSTSEIETWAYENNKILMTVDGLVFPCEGADGIRWDVTKRIAHEEWLKISERYKRMNDYLRGSGWHVGRAPYGYRSVKAAGDAHKTLIIAPAEADVIRDACAWYLGGMSLDGICAKLNAAGRLPRAMKDGHQPQWMASTISKVLHNEVVAGRQKDASGKTIQKVEPIVSREIWDAVIDRLALRSKRKGVSQSRTPAMLTSIIVCTRCGKGMYRTGLNYYCRRCHTLIRIADADAMVHETMRTDHRRDIIEVVARGSGHAAEIAEVKRDLSEAVESEEFKRIPGLQAELERLRALPASPTRVERRESDKTVAEMWAAMPDDAARRAYLMERHAYAGYAEDGHGGWLLSNLGQPQQLR